MRLDGLDHFPQQGLHPQRRFFQARVVDGLHRGNGINGGDLGSIAAEFLDDDIARQHGADLVLQLQRLMRELWIARA